MRETFYRISRIEFSIELDQRYLNLENPCQKNRILLSDSELMSQVLYFFHFHPQIAHIDLGLKF